MTNDLIAMWEELVPGHPDVAVALLARWQEPRRDYHGLRHLRYGLWALEKLGAAPVETIAWWFHDAVHTNTTPSDELASAVMARELLEGVLPSAEVEEVARLVLLTINHDPENGDDAGERLCDADLAILGASPEQYDASVKALRQECVDLPEPAWVLRRTTTTAMLLNRQPLFRTPEGHERWERRARANLERERAQLYGLSTKGHA